ncbi:MAG TPA: carboxypeptidase M32 [Gemmatimonadales bacterium]|nr:carboxypeptidase M32 [Gemmatimonadales bacterium]
MTPETAYADLVRRAREEALLASCADLLEWDEETYMPKAGVAHRSEQRALLAGLLHERGTDPRYGELLDVLEGSELLQDPDAAEAVNVRWLRHEYEREKKLPRSLVEEGARVASLAYEAWIEAKENADYAAFRPWLERLVGLSRAEAEALGYADTPYDALLEEYEPGVRTADVAALFAVLQQELLALLGEVGGSSRKPQAKLLRRDFPVDRQRLFSEAVASALGFDFEGGRLDLAEHPFCTAVGPGDVRLTARYDSRSFPRGFFAVLHEMGHGLYEQGLDRAHFGLPMGEVVSLGMHESQSRLWENLVGRSRPFWRAFYPRTRAIFRDALHDVKLDDFHFAICAVRPGANRVEADEITYNLHIFIRFELERALIAGDLTAAELPGAWNDAYRRLLGVTPADDAEGVLQDSHWAAGLFGYFPAYTLGNVYAAQFLEAAERDVGDFAPAWGKGDFSGLLGWLRDNVHRHGRRWTSAELVRRATGAPPDPAPLITGLRRKYGELYAL